MFKKCVCAIAVLTSHGWAAELIEATVSTHNFQSGNFIYSSVKTEDKAEFEALKETHNTQPDALARVPEIMNVFDNQIARRNGGNAWHALTVRDAESNEMAAALIIGRIATTGYKSDEHAGIQSFIRSLDITSEDNTRIANRGLATYVLMTDMAKMADHLTEFHKNAFSHCNRLVNATELLPIEKTIPTHVALLVRPNAPDALAMTAAGYTLHSQTDNPGFSKWYPPKATDVWVKALLHNLASVVKKIK